MEDNDTIEQLSKALNQLLDAYEELQNESKELKEENAYLKEEIDDLELRNKGLDTRLAALNDTSKHQSTEMGTMLGRIEDILNRKIIDEIEEEDFETDESLSDEPSTEKILDDDDSLSEDSNQHDTKDIDLARVQSMLNGFNN